MKIAVVGEWGGSLAVRVGEREFGKIEVEKGDQVLVKVEGNKIIIEKVEE